MMHITDVSALHMTRFGPLNLADFAYRYGGGSNGYSGGASNGYSNGYGSGYGASTNGYGGGDSFGGGDKMSNLGANLKTQQWGRSTRRRLAIAIGGTDNCFRHCDHAQIRKILLQGGPTRHFSLPT